MQVRRGRLRWASRDSWVDIFLLFVELADAAHVESDTVYISVSFKSTPPQNRQLNMLTSFSKQQVVDFVGELTLNAIAGAEGAVAVGFARFVGRHFAPVCRAGLLRV